MQTWRCFLWFYSAMLLLGVQIALAGFAWLRSRAAARQRAEDQTRADGASEAQAETLQTIAEGADAQSQNNSVDRDPRDVARRLRTDAAARAASGHRG